MNRSAKTFARSVMCVAMGAALATTAYAQDSAPKRKTSALLEEVVVTARKREEGSQDIPIAVSAFNADQIDALKVRNLTNLAVGMPSVVLDEIGTSRGYANFSIRGLGVNSSIPSIDPAVGIIVDGVYLGTNSGVVFDTFDLESVEVLRGPQGTLFGRNVTGGAVLLNTAKPSQEFGVKAKVAYDQSIEGTGGGNAYIQGSITGGVTDTLALKLSAYYNDDSGAVTNEFDGSDHGAQEQTILRPSLLWTPNEDLDVLLRYEYQKIDADGPSGQNHTNGRGVDPFWANFSRDDFGFSIDEPGYNTLEVDFFNATVNYQIAGGTLTNVFGYRTSEAGTNGDIDAQPVWIYHSDTHSAYDQMSNELRWNGLMMEDKLNLTIGAYYFDSTLEYDEDRNLLGIATGGVRPALTQSGGGILDVTSMGFFVAGDYDINEKLQLTAGLRWSREEKEAKVTTLSNPDPLVNGGVNQECWIGSPGGIGYSGPEQPCDFDFVDDQTWNFVSPKLGLMYQLTDSSRMYLNWSRGFRSGGYNLRNTEVPLADGSFEVGPGPFDKEQADSVELGYKTEWDKGKLNFSVYQTKIKDMQREVNLSSASAGVLQLILNTADATIFGFEVDGTFSLSDNLTLKASAGWLSDTYDEVRFDLNGDGVVDGKDKDLTLPRAPGLTWNLTGIYDVDFGDVGYLSTLVSYGFRDETMYTDNNLGYINQQRQLDMAMDFHTAGGQWVYSLYGRNLLNEVRHGGDTQLPTMLGPVPLGGTFSPINKPAVVGFEVTYKM